MTREELIRHCLQLADAREDSPFAEGDHTILRHRSNGRWFALITQLDGKLCINLKCDPMEAGFLRKVYQGVRPGWHMNKQHWNTVEVESDVPQEALLEMIRESYRLTAPKPRRRPGSEPAD